MRTLLVVTLLSVSILLSAGCTSRYKTALYMTLEETRQKVKIEAGRYVLDSRIGNPYATEKLINGDHAVAVVLYGGRWKAQGKANPPVFEFDEYLHCELYLHVPQPAKPDSIELVGNSVVGLLGRFDRPAEIKTFVPTSGFAKIDSVVSDKAFITVDGLFENAAGHPLELSGNLKLKLMN